MKREAIVKETCNTHVKNGSCLECGASADRRKEEAVFAMHMASKHEKCSASVEIREMHHRPHTTE